MIITEEQTMDVVLKLIQTTSTLSNPFTITHECGRIVFKTTKILSQLSCSILVNNDLIPLWFLRTDVSFNFDYMINTPQYYDDIVLYSSDSPDLYWLINGESTCCTPDEVLDSSFHFNLNINDDGLLSRNLKIVHKFRETEGAHALLNENGYQLLMYSFTDEMVKKLIKIQEEGVITI